MKFHWAAWLRPSVFVVAALFASGISAIFFPAAKERGYFFEVEVTNQRSSRIQLFYDIGRGFTEEDSSVHPLLAQPGSVHYRFRIPSGKIQGLRLDPTETVTTLTIAKPAIVGFGGSKVQKFAIRDLVPRHQAEITRSETDSINLKSTGNDPYLEIHLDQPLSIGTNGADVLKLLVPLGFIVFSICWFGAGLVEAIPRMYILSLGEWLRNRPLTTIIGTSLLGVLIQCHPVIFFGKSFVSPENGTFFLYDRAPTLPTYKSETPEDPKGSDVAALFHGSLSYPSLQRRALVRDHELPLWDRYLLGGSTLLGQGQSMFGSLLNFISIIGDSSAASWDLRFVLSRWLYGAGLGVAAWLLVGHIGVASLISFIGLFIGFFGHRLNHMAQFSVDLSPWIIVGWALLKKRPSSRAAVLLFLANWEVMMSGTVKEAYMLILCLNFAGFLIVSLSDLNFREKLIRIGVASLCGLCLILISAPVWMVFLDSLGRGWTRYDQPSVQQALPWQLLGFFDEMFYRRFIPNETHVLPSVNFAILAGVVWSIVAAPLVWRQKAAVALSLSIIIPTLLVFGLIPSSLLMELPFIKNIYHIHNTFSCPLLILSSLLASFGFKAMWTAAHEPSWWRNFAEFSCIISALFLLYYGSTVGPPSSDFFGALVISLCIGLLLIHVGLRSWAGTQHLGVLVLSVGGGAVLLGWQNSQYIKSPADEYVFNPGIRADLRGRSDAVGQLDQILTHEPSRVVGLGNNLFAGYSAMLHWETIYGVDAVGNADFAALCDAADMRKRDWGDPRLWHEDDLTVILPIQNLLNVRYYLATHQEIPAEIKGLKWVASRDLDIYESPTVWPRAFYTDQYTTYAAPTDLVALVRNNPSHPLAALPPGANIANLPPTPPSQLNNIVVPALGYRLTTNTTKFTIEAPRAGLAVLAENYVAADFRACLNGKPVPYFQVNQAGKGIAIPAAGKYEITFEYWPERLPLGLILMAGGLLGGAILLSWRIYTKRMQMAALQDSRGVIAR